MQRVTLRNVGPRVAGRMRTALAWFRLVRGMRRTGRRTELWIGDSHAMSFNRNIALGTFLTGPDGQVILRVGARLMRSLAIKDFPPRVLRICRVVGRAGIPGSVVPFFVAGEIDVRCHLADHPDEDFGFVADYVKRCHSVSRLLNADGAVVVVPPPPCDYSTDDYSTDLPTYRIRGSLEQRLLVFRTLRSALVDAVAPYADIELLDCTDVLAGASGAMRPDLTDDSCHTNLSGVQLVRARVRSLNLADRSTSPSDQLSAGFRRGVNEFNHPPSQTG